MFNLFIAKLTVYTKFRYTHGAIIILIYLHGSDSDVISYN